MSDLKPCPFCGGEAELRLYNGGIGDPYSARGACLKCEAMGPQTYWIESKKFKEIAVNKWNRRVEE